jgi:hypothetical protein
MTFVSMKISIARIFPSNFISHKGVKTREISQWILISSSLKMTRLISRIIIEKILTSFHRHFLYVFELLINAFEDVYEFHQLLIYEKIHQMIQHPTLPFEWNNRSTNYDLHDKITNDFHYQHLNSILVVYFFERVNPEIEHKSES